MEAVFFGRMNLLTETVPLTNEGFKKDLNSWHKTAPNYSIFFSTSPTGRTIRVRKG